ncbi:MAG: prepilin-type N-terminal cleavage/methylation domain-containing protein [Candidatus Omnitrophota bacterium]|nr:prepilin-type N-terminal cleavage/methylation domain-containing protein [Candidatus Omnitrophota bacterium]
MNRGHKKSFTLLELLISLFLFSMSIIFIGNLRVFAYNRVVETDRQLRLQNELTVIVEDMGKNILRSVGDSQSPGISCTLTNGTVGLRLRVDNGDPPTASNYGDDIIVEYYVSGNSFYAVEASSQRTITSRPIIASPNFCTLLTGDEGPGVEIYLVARNNPAVARSPSNAQSRVLTRIYSRSSGSH